ncbi:MAG: response regulator [Deltaproteobacteria bacterium]|nr:response regulator [Deltaproteobacteria bacterium]
MPEELGRSLDVGPGCRVLIVDDDRDLAESLADILESRGYVVGVAHSARDAREITSEFESQVAFIDLKLPDGSGTEVLSYLKKILPSCVFVIMTAYADLDSAVSALEKGALHYLRKPVQPAEFLRLLEGAVETIDLRKEKKQAVEALRQSEENYRSLVESIVDWVWAVDADGRYTFSNSAVKNLLNYEVGDVVGVLAWSLVHPGDREMFQVLLQKAVAEKTGWTDLALRRIHQDEGERFFESSAQPIFDAAGQLIGFTGVDRDVTARRRLESQLQRAQKMEAIGTLAGGIAHDFNNLLQAIQGFSELLLLEAKENDPIYKRLQGIYRAAKRGGILTRQLLAFSRKVEVKLQQLDLNHEIRELRKLLDHTLPKMIGIGLRLADDLWSVEADPAQIEQVLMNLAINAKDAMPDGGDLIIETKNYTITDRYGKTYPDINPGDYVLISIIDTGHGMSKDIQAHIFEPFFTTKESGRGTGLGLAMVYGIVKKHGGHVMCYSEPGHGTTFNIFLQAIPQVAPAGPEEKTQRPIYEGGTETILLVDDEEFIIHVGRQVLTKFGYTVFTAVDGESALEVYREKGNNIDLVLMDLIMPGMGGRKCLTELLKINPDLKVVMASGFAGPEPANMVIKEGARGFLNKPYETREMLRLIRQVLDQDKDKG